MPVTKVEAIRLLRPFQISFVESLSFLPKDAIVYTYKSSNPEEGATNDH